MDFKSDALDKRQTFRRCNSEPPLIGRLTASSPQSNPSAHSLQEIKANHQKKIVAQKLSPGGRSGTVVRSSTFPLLPTLNNKPRNGHQVVICSENAENHKETAFPLFSNLGYSSREIIPNQRGLLQARKYDLKSRYTRAIDAMKVPVVKKQPTSNPLRKRVQEISDVVDKDLNVLDDSDELLSDLYSPFSGHQSTIRRLSVITEKSNFSRTSNKTALFDLEDENETNRSILPSVEKNRVNKRPSYLEKNSRKLQEHVKMTEKQFNALESKATLLSSWFKTLEMEG